MKIVKSLFTTMVTALIILSVAFLLIQAVNISPIKALSAFFRSVFGSFYGLSEVLVRMIPLLLTALGVSVGFRTGFFNIGAEGQIYMGASAATAFGLLFSAYPAIILIPGALLCAFLAGGIWSIIPGFLKARFGLSEIINTIMFNYIAINIVGILVRTVLKDPAYPLPMSPGIPEKMKLLPLIYPTRLHTGLLIALTAAIIIYVLLWKTTIGFKMRCVGLNPRAAYCAGISPYIYILTASLISGGLAGLAGASEIMGIHHKLLEGISPGFGYIAIIIALLGNNHPFKIIVSAFGIAALQIGSATMQRQTGVPASISWIIMGILVLMILIKEHMQFKTMAKDVTK